MAFSTRESVLVDELNVFAGGILANYSTYQVPQPDAITIRLAVDEFIAARDVAVPEDDDVPRPRVVTLRLAAATRPQFDRRRATPAHIRKI